MQNELSLEMGPQPERIHLAIHILRGDLRGPSADRSRQFLVLSAVIGAPQSSIGWTDDFPLHEFLSSRLPQGSSADPPRISCGSSAMRVEEGFQPSS